MPGNPLVRYNRGEWFAPQGIALSHTLPFICGQIVPAQAALWRTQCIQPEPAIGPAPGVTRLWRRIVQQIDIAYPLASRLRNGQPERVAVQRSRHSVASSVPCRRIAHLHRNNLPRRQYCPNVRLMLIHPPHFGQRQGWILQRRHIRPQRLGRPFRSTAASGPRSPPESHAPATPYVLAPDRA